MTAAKIFAAIAVGLFLTACKPATQTDRTNNPDISVDLLFEKDGCQVYRFWDFGWHYFASCPGSAVTTPKVCGKGCIRDEEIPTVGEPPRQ